MSIEHLETRVYQGNPADRIRDVIDHQGEVVDSFERLDERSDYTTTRLNLLEKTADIQKLNLEQAMLSPDKFIEAITPGLSDQYQKRSVIELTGDRAVQRFVTLNSNNNGSTQPEMLFTISGGDNQPASLRVESYLRDMFEGGLFVLTKEAGKSACVELCAWHRGQYVKKALSPAEELVYAQAIFTDMLVALDNKNPEDDFKALQLARKM